MTREEAINKIRQWSLPKETRDILEALAPELRENEDENLKNKSGYYKDGKFWKASTLWNATKNKIPQRVSNIYNILRECTWNIRTLKDFAKEVKNVQEVSLDYPIILDMNGNILDGAHRVVKAYLEEKDIDIVYLGDDEWPEPDYDEEKAVKESEDERTKKSLIKFLTDIKEISESGRTSWAVRKEDAEMCKSFLDYLGKQKVQNEITIEQVYREFINPEKLKDAKTNKYIRAQLLWELMHNGIITEVDYQYLTDDKRKPWTAEEYRIAYQKGFDTSEQLKQKEQKPNIELIQRSWYMEGYRDREFGQEPKWIIKTGEGGPKHELNPKYGQPLTEQQVTEEQLHNLNEAIKSFRMDGFDRIADSLHSLYNILSTQGVEPVPFSCGHENGKPADSVFSKQEYESSPIISTDTTSMKPVERSLEDDHIIGFVYDLLNEIEWKDDWAMSKEECLRLLSNYSPQKITGVTINGEPISTENQSVDIPLAEWSEEDKKMLNHLIDKIQENLNIRMPDGYSFGISNDEKETFSSWLRCLPERFNLQPNQEWSEEDEAAYNAFICEVVNEKMNPTVEQVKWLRGICDRLKSFYPQSKQEWNNEDESILNTIITDVGFVQRKCGIGTNEWNVRSKAIQWLKNLLERFNPPKQKWKEVELEFRGEKVKVKRPFFRDNKGREYSTTEQDEDVAWYALRAWCNKKGISLDDLYPKAEWSDEDESSLKELIHYFESLLDCLATEKRHAENRKWLKFLKSLRPQYHGDVTMTEAYKMGFEAGKASSWKPSKEQMDSLRDTMANTKGYSYSIYLLDLYEQLKKLV